VDVAVLNRADPLVLEQVTEHCELVYDAPRRLAEFKSTSTTNHHGERLPAAGRLPRIVFDV
jgi:hypothetical protein